MDLGAAEYSLKIGAPGWREGAPILVGVNVDDVRNYLVALLQARIDREKKAATTEVERQVWTQTPIAKRAGISQGAVSKLLNLEENADRIEMRTVIGIIEGNLAPLKVSDFFAQIERGQTTADSIDSRKPGISTASSVPAHASHTVRPGKDKLKPIVDEVLFRVAAAVGDAAAAGSADVVGKSHRSVSKPRGKKRTGGKKSAANR